MTEEQAYQQMIDDGVDPDAAAKMAALGFESYEDWLAHHLNYRDWGQFPASYHEQMVRY